MLKMTRGDDRTVRTVVNDTDGEPYVWAGSEVWFTAKRHWSDDDDEAIISLHSEEDGEIDLSTAGVALSKIPAAATKVLPNEDVVKLHYDIQLKNAVGDVYTVEVGSLMVEPEATHAPEAP